MEAERVRRVIALYKHTLIEKGIQKKEYTHGVLLSSGTDGLAHCLCMIDKFEGFIQEDRMDKVFRWLGFIQGMLCAERIFTIQELQLHNYSKSPLPEIPGIATTAP